MREAIVMVLSSIAMAALLICGIVLFIRHDAELMYQDKRISSADEIPVLVQMISFETLVRFGDEYMMEKIRNHSIPRWYYAYWETKLHWRKMLSLSIGRQADLADTVSKYAPWIEDSDFLQDIPEGNLTALAKTINLTGLANIASATLAARKRGILAAEWTTAYESLSSELKKLHASL